jgi:hypothetical protein
MSSTVRFESAACDPGTEKQAPIASAGDAHAMAREAMVRARSALRTATMDRPKDLEVGARQYVLGRRIAELTEAIGALDLATQSKAGV